ncbi:MAG: patatin-like phospholipase family protein [Alphaproteobacteria bacterium]|nr:MAG: patatin-like phospholipase family protein [Alphaproteobacteria bacterium]
MADLALALSGGGAAGLGHIPVLEGLDALGRRPVAIAGTSIGALMGAAYAAGLSGAEIRAHVMELLTSPSRAARRLWEEARFDGLGRLLSLDARAIVSVVLPARVPRRFEELQVPLTVVATDFHGRAERRLSRGDLRAALAASIAIPGVVRPVVLEGRVMVDGGVTNNLPVEALPRGPVTVAVDVASEPPSDATEVPNGLELSLGALRILMQELLEVRLSRRPPDVLIRPPCSRFMALEFYRATEILEAAEPARAETSAAVARVLNLREA